jgi:hypothetical protein
LKFKTDELLERARLDERHSSLSSAEKTFADEAAAARVFASLKTRLSDIDEWNAHAMLSSFRLFDENGRPLESKRPALGIFLRISLTGTLKYDWVRVVDIFEGPDEFIVTVRPTFDPSGENPDQTVISHFFTDESINNFCLVRRAHQVALYVIGLNEKFNAGETGGALETARNAAVNLGSYLGVQRGEWEKFCHHFLEDQADERAV